MYDMIHPYPNTSFLNKQQKTKKQTRTQTIKKFTPTRNLENDAILFGFTKNKDILKEVLNSIRYTSNKNKIIKRLLNIIYETILHKMDKIKSYQMQSKTELVYGKLFVPIRH
jgi:hypothetical protein